MGNLKKNLHYFVFHVVQKRQFEIRPASVEKKQEAQEQAQERQFPPLLNVSHHSLLELECTDGGVRGTVSVPCHGSLSTFDNITNIHKYSLGTN